jgi:hypothetical protein
MAAPSMKSELITGFRAVLALIGLLLVSGGLMGLLASDVVYSEAPPVGRMVLPLIAVGAFGYGLLLLLPLPLLSRSPWTLLTLAACAASYGLGGVLMSQHEHSSLAAAFGVAVRLLPGAAAIGLVMSERRRQSRLREAPPHAAR